MMRSSIALAVLCAAPAAMAGINEYVMPPSYENVAGPNVFIGPLANGPRTYQLLMHADMLTDLLGQPLDGISWRLPPAATEAWPASDATFGNYDIYLSGSVAPADRSTANFSSNVVGLQTQVRSGALTIFAGEHPSGGSPNEWGTKIGFNTPYTYTGGHLLLEIRHTGSNSNSRNVDAIGTAVSGYGTLFSAAWATGAAANNGSQGNFSIFRFTAVPAPSAAAVMGLGLLAGLRRRR